MQNRNIGPLMGPPMMESNMNGIPWRSWASVQHSITQWTNARQKIGMAFPMSSSI